MANKINEEGVVEKREPSADSDSPSPPTQPDTPPLLKDGLELVRDVNC
jgi:hypothetical protein